MQFTPLEPKAHQARSPYSGFGSRVACWPAISAIKRISFLESPPTNLGWVTNVDQPNFRGYFLSTEWYKSDFAQFYDVLRSERPIYFAFAYTPSMYDPNDPTRDLTINWFYIDPEPLGEGPAEMLPGVSSSEMHFALSNTGEAGSTDASGRGSVQE